MEDIRRKVRQFELVGYASFLLALRAQGRLTRERRKILQDVTKYMSIPTERYRAEMRRVAYHPEASSIADSLCGSSTASEWYEEGRRLVPIQRRGKVATDALSVANAVANSIMQKLNNEVKDEKETITEAEVTKKVSDELKKLIGNKVEKGDDSFEKSLIPKKDFLNLKAKDLPVAVKTISSKLCTENRKTLVLPSGAELMLQQAESRPTSPEISEQMPSPVESQQIVELKRRSVDDLVIPPPPKKKSKHSLLEYKSKLSPMSSHSSSPTKIGSSEELSKKVRPSTIDYDNLTQVLETIDQDNSTKLDYNINMSADETNASLEGIEPTKIESEILGISKTLTPVEIKSSKMINRPITQQKTYTVVTSSLTSNFSPTSASFPFSTSTTMASKVITSLYGPKITPKPITTTTKADFSSEFADITVPVTTQITRPAQNLSGVVLVKKPTPVLSTYNVLPESSILKDHHSYTAPPSANVKIIASSKDFKKPAYRVKSGPHTTVLVEKPQQVQPTQLQPLRRIAVSRPSTASNQMVILHNPQSSSNIISQTLHHNIPQALRDHISTLSEPRDQHFKPKEDRIYFPSKTDSDSRSSTYSNLPASVSADLDSLLREVEGNGDFGFDDIPVATNKPSVRSIEDFSTSSIRVQPLSAVSSSEIQNVIVQSQPTIKTGPTSASTLLHFPESKIVTTAVSQGLQVQIQQLLNTSITVPTTKPDQGTTSPIPLHISKPRWLRKTSYLLDAVMTYRGEGENVCAEPLATPFLHPVCRTNTEYYEKVSNPIDLNTIQTKLMNNAYNELDDFHEDMLLLKTNCVVFYSTDSEVYAKCTRLFEFYMSEYKKLVKKLEKRLS